MGIDLRWPVNLAAGMRKNPPAADPALFRRLDLNLLKIFREISRSGGISAAARRLGLQQPAVSLALRRLEDHIGEPLCERSARGVALTPAGRVLAEVADSMFDAVQSLPQTIAERTGEVEGVLTIRTISGVVSPELDDTLDAMRRRHPRVRLRIDVAPRRILLDALLKGQAEICITFDSEPQSPLAYEPLVREYQQLYCARSHPLYGASVTRPEALAGERLVLTGLDEPQEVKRFRLRYGLGLKPSGEAENLEEAKRLIRAGVGIGFLPTVLIEDSMRRDAFWPLLPAAMLPNYRLYIVTHPEARRTVPTQVFLNEIRRRLRARGAAI